VLAVVAVMSLWDTRTRPAAGPRAPSAAAPRTRPAAAPRAQHPATPRTRPAPAHNGEGKAGERSGPGRERDEAGHDVNTVYSRQ